MNLNTFLNNAGVKSGDNIIVHSSFRKIRSAFPSISPYDVVEELKKKITTEGSLVFPAFTYCYKRSTGSYELFDRTKSKSKTGLISEIFRNSADVVRTSSPTHSFSMWGRITKFIGSGNSPTSPLGDGSVLDWFANEPESYVLMLGTDFSSLTFGHYIEIKSSVPWINYSPWDHLNVLPIGMTVDSMQELIQIPGCARPFINFENYLIENNLLQQFQFSGLAARYENIYKLLKEGIIYFSREYRKLLCPESTCEACDSRRKKIIGEI